MYRAVIDPLHVNTKWMDARLPLLLLLALALSSSASAGVAPLHISPSAGTDADMTIPITTAPDPQISIRSGSFSSNTTTPPYGFNRGFDKPYQRMTILIAALLFASLVFGFCAHYVTLRPCHVRRGGDQGGGEPLEEGGRGLDPLVVRSLPMVRYEVAARVKEGKRVSDEEAAGAATPPTKQECSVCLCEFEEGEEMKVLPECGHAFHSACIDMWLFSHTTCPICRLSLKKSSSQKNSASCNIPPRGLQSILPRGPHRASGNLATIIDQRPDLLLPASTPSTLHSETWHLHVDDDVVEDARDSSARDSSARNSSVALYPHFASSS